MKTLKLIAAAGLLAYAFVGCNPADKDKKIGGSPDSSSVNRSGGPPITDTGNYNTSKAAT